MTQTRGFLLGKFMPLHEGHLFLCDTASEMVDILTVLVCTRECEPIDGILRLKWMQESVRPNVQVVHLHRDIPQEPGEHPEFWDIWRNTIKELHPEPIDLVFGSEDYVLRLAMELDAESFVLDKQRNFVPVSSTDIRSNPEAHWQYVPEAVRAYYQKRICMLGPESTGKSQMSQDLAARFETHHVPEYGRTYDEMFRQGKNWQASDFIAIAQGHQALQRQIAREAGYVYFEDTDLLQTVVWAEYLLGDVPGELSKLLENWDFAHYYLLLNPDVTWSNDGTRYSGDAEVRTWFFEKLESLLVRLQLPYQVITGSDWSKRIDDANSAIHKKV